MAKRVKRGLDPLRIGLLLGPQERQAILDERFYEEHRRMCSLADAMQIPEGPARWYLLALELARQHVPELKEEKPRGAPAKWSQSHWAILGGELSRMIDQGVSEAAAAEELAGLEPWRSFLTQKDGTFDHTPGEALLKQYKRDPRWCRMGADMRRMYEEHGQPEKWQEFVADVFENAPRPK